MGCCCSGPPTWGNRCKHYLFVSPIYCDLACYHTFARGPGTAHIADKGNGGIENRDSPDPPSLPLPPPPLQDMDFAVSQGASVERQVEAGNLPSNVRALLSRLAYMCSEERVRVQVIPGQT